MRVVSNFYPDLIRREAERMERTCFYVSEVAEKEDISPAGINELKNMLPTIQETYRELVALIDNICENKESENA